YPGRDPHQMVSGGDRLDEAEFDYSHSHHEASAPLGAPTWQHQRPHGTPTPHDEHIPTQPYGQENAAFLDDGEAMGPHDHEIYDDAPPSRWRKGATTAISIMACAVLAAARGVPRRRVPVLSASFDARSAHCARNGRLAAASCCLADAGGERTQTRAHRHDSAGWHRSQRPARKQPWVFRRTGSCVVDSRGAVRPDRDGRAWT